MFERSKSPRSSSAVTNSLLNTALNVTYPFGGHATHPMFQQVTEWLDIVTYKPGWRFELRPLDISLGYGRYVGRLWTRFKCEDSTGRRTSSYSGDQFEVLGNHLVPEYICEDQTKFYTYLHHCITELEHHELDEWFRVGGRLVSNPHDARDPEVWKPGNEKFTKKSPQSVRWNPTGAQLREESYYMKEEFLETQVRGQAGD